MKITLDLDDDIVKRIEELTGTDIKELLESELNDNGDVFIEIMGYDNE